ncbi:MAG: bifunctional sugar-1-phosphate nucleotidylyltransferase/acetyltransferase [Candidatus Baldrarchaeia archaeon]
MVRLRLKALVLAGGLGQRLRPITNTRPKPMIEIAGRPLLFYLLQTLSALDIRDVYMVIGYKGEQIRDYFKSGESLGLHITYLEQKEPMGIRDAILRGEKFLESDERFIILHADVLLEPELVKRTLQAFDELNADIVLAVTLVGEPHLHTVVSFDENSQVRYVVERPKNGTEPSNYAITGVYVCSSEIFDVLRKSLSFTEALNTLSARGRAFVTIWEREWVELQYPWDILRANSYVLNRILRGRGSFISERAEIMNDVKIEGSVWISDNAVIRQGTVIKGPSYIGENSYIGNNSLIREYTSIGENSIIGFGVETKNSVIFDGTKVGRLSFIGDSIIGSNVDIGAGTQTWNTPLRGRTISIEINGERIRVPMEKFGAIIGDNTRIGINVSIMPGIIIGNDSEISAGVIVDRNIPPNCIVKLKYELAIERRS